MTTGPAHTMNAVERTVRRILWIGLAVSIALMAVGVALGLLREAHLPSGVVPMGKLAAGLAKPDAAAYLSLGLVVLIGTPFVRVAGSLLTFAHQRDRRYVLVTGVVLAVMCLSVVLGKA
jgi:uncharacterized membrane protein